LIEAMVVGPVESIAGLQHSSINANAASCIP